VDDFCYPVFIKEVFLTGDPVAPDKCYGEKPSKCAYTVKLK